MKTARRKPPAKREAAALRARVVELVRGGATRKAAAAACGLHIRTVEAACVKAGMRGNRRVEWTPERDAWLTANPGRLNDERAVRAALGCSTTAARNRASLLSLPAADPRRGMAPPPANELAAMRILERRGRAAAGELAAALGERFPWEATQALQRSGWFERDGRLWSLSGMGWAALRDAKGGGPDGPCDAPSARMGRFRFARRPAHRTEAS